MKMFHDDFKFAFNSINSFWFYIFSLFVFTILRLVMYKFVILLNMKHSHLDLHKILHYVFNKDMQIFYFFETYIMYIVGI